MDHKSHLLEGAKKSFFSFFIKNARVAFMVAIATMIWGLSAVLTIPKESAPQIDYGIIVVSTFYDGASAVDMDSLVTQEIENKVKDVSAIRKMNSTSRNSFSTVTMELEPDADIGKTLNDIRSKVDEAKPKLPEDAEDPTIVEISSSNESPLFDVHLTGDIHPALMRDYAERVKTFLESSSDINSVDISGGAEREIFVDIDPLKLEQYGISSSSVSDAIRTSHRDAPLGDFTIDGLEYSLRFEGRHKNAQDVRNIIITTIQAGSQHSVVTVNDVANVYESQEETDTFTSFINTETGERTPSVKLSVGQTKNRDIFKIDPKIRAQLYEYVENNFGDEVGLYFTNETLDNVVDSYSNVINSGSMSIAIVVLILMFFIGIRESLAASLVIPLAFLTTIGVTGAMGETLNFMVNFSMILALGILVDTAIVVIEGIHEGIAKGFSPKEAAMLAVEEFKAPLISGMLTTLAVFIPLFTLPGILGQYLSYIPISVSITLAASLTFSLFIIPAIAASILHSKEEKAAAQEKPSKFSYCIRAYQAWYKKKYQMFTEKYQHFMSTKLRKRSWRMSAIFSVFILCFLSFSFPIQFNMFPSDDQPILITYVKMPEGTVKEDTLNVVIPVEERLKTIPEVEKIETSINNNEATIQLSLLDKDIRESQGMRTSIQIADELREEFKAYKNYEVNIRELATGPPSESPVGMKIIMDDANKLSIAQGVAQDFKAILKTIPGADDVKDDITNIPGEVTYRVNREEALRLGVNPSAVSAAARTAINGSTAATITRGGREVDVTVRYNENTIQNFDDISNIQIQNNQGEYISLSQVVTRELNSAFSEIKRADRKISIKVSSQLTKDGNALEVTNAFKKEIENYDLPDGITVEDAGENAENSDLFIALGFGFVMAVFMIFAILVIQFNSYAYPFIILFTIVMSLLGVNTGLFLTDTPRSLAFIIGFISLGGIVVNDAIILVDRINKLKEKYSDQPLEKIISFAGSSRLQPIMLTTMTTAAGIFPLIFVDTFWAGLAYTIIFGLTVASTLTLFVTPAMYYQFDNEMGLTFLAFPIAIGVFMILKGIIGLSIIPILIGAIIAGIFYFFFKRKLKKIRQPAPVLHIEEQ